MFKKNIFKIIWIFFWIYIRKYYKKNSEILIKDFQAQNPYIYDFFYSKY